jgi:hypothetical protein
LHRRSDLEHRLRLYGRDLNHRLGNGGFAGAQRLPNLRHVIGRLFRNWRRRNHFWSGCIDRRRVSLDARLLNEFDR